MTLGSKFHPYLINPWSNSHPTLWNWKSLVQYTTSFWNHYLPVPHYLSLTNFTHNRELPKAFSAFDVMWTAWRRNFDDIIGSGDFGRIPLRSKRSKRFRVQRVPCWYFFFSVFLYEYKVYSSGISTRINDLPKVLNFNQLFLNSTGSSVTSGRLSLFIESHPTLIKGIPKL